MTDLTARDTSELYVHLAPSALRTNVDGPVPLVERAFGTARGHIVTRGEQHRGTLEVDGVTYTYRDARSQGGRQKKPLGRFKDADFIFCFRPVVASLEGGQEPPLLEIVGLRKSLEEPGLVEIIGTIESKREGLGVLAVRAPGKHNAGLTAIQGDLKGDVGDRVQVFARLSVGKLLLEAEHPLVPVPKPLTPPSPIAKAVDEEEADADSDEPTAGADEAPAASPEPSQAIEADPDSPEGAAPNAE